MADWLRTLGYKNQHSGEELPVFSFFLIYIRLGAEEAGNEFRSKKKKRKQALTKARSLAKVL